MKRGKHAAWHRTDAFALDVEDRQIAVICAIGRTLARHLASLGAHVIVVGQTFRDARVSKITSIQADLSLMCEAQRVAAELPAETLDMVIFTPGIFTAPQWQETVGSIKRGLAINYLNQHLNQLIIVSAIAPRLCTQRLDARMKPRVFLMGGPDSGQIGTPDDLNAGQFYKAMPAHMNTVAWNSMRVPDAVRRYPYATAFGLNPSLIKTNNRDNFFGKDTLKPRVMETPIGWFAPTAGAEQHRADAGADIEGYSGAVLDSKVRTVLPSDGLTEAHIRTFMAASGIRDAHAGIPHTAA